MHNLSQKGRVIDGLFLKQTVFMEEFRQVSQKKKKNQQIPKPPKHYITNRATVFHHGGNSLGSKKKWEEKGT